MDHYIFVSLHIGHFTPQLNVNKIASIITFFCLCRKQTASFGMTSFILLLLFCCFCSFFFNFYKCYFSGYAAVFLDCIPSN